VTYTLKRVAFGGAGALASSSLLPIARVTVRPADDHGAAGGLGSKLNDENERPAHPIPKRLSTAARPPGLLRFMNSRSSRFWSIPGMNQKAGRTAGRGQHGSSEENDPTQCIFSCSFHGVIRLHRERYFVNAATSL